MALWYYVGTQESDSSCLSKGERKDLEATASNCDLWWKWKQWDLGFVVENDGGHLLQLLCNQSQSRLVCLILLWKTAKVRASAPCSRWSKWAISGEDHHFRTKPNQSTPRNLELCAQCLWGTRVPCGQWNHENIGEKPVLTATKNHICPRISCMENVMSSFYNSQTVFSSDKWQQKCKTQDFCLSNVVKTC